jgi:cyclomaltodextrinase
MTEIHTPEWVKDAIFYQIFPDRFARSERLDRRGLHFEPWDSPPTLFGFKGGDLYGIVEHLDYLQDLGITALYLNPIFASASNHRYHTYDYYNVDPLLGGNQALRELLDEAHRRGIRVILDGVFNHASRGFWQFHHVLENGDGSPYVDWFYFDPQRLQRKKPWGAYPHPEEEKALRRGEDSLIAIGYRAWWNLPALPKFNTHTPAVRDFLFGVAEHWIRFGIDGWRLDVPAEIDDDSFWQEFRSRVKAINPEAYIVGEIWERADRWLRGDQFDAVMNYPIGEACLSFFGRESLNFAEIRKAGYGPRIHPIDGKEFARRWQEISQWYHPQIVQAQLNLIDSHDTPRFLTAAGGDRQALKLAWLTLFTYPGAPCIYYGDEIGLDGGHDPDCRKSFPWHVPERWDHDLLAYLKACIAMRKLHPALRRGHGWVLYADPDVVVLGRQNAQEKLIIALNASRQTKTVRVDLNGLNFAAGRWGIVFGEGRVEVHADQPCELYLPPQQGLVFGETH